MAVLSLQWESPHMERRESNWYKAQFPICHIFVAFGFRRFTQTIWAYLNAIWLGTYTYQIITGKTLFPSERSL